MYEETENVLCDSRIYVDEKSSMRKSKKVLFRESSAGGETEAVGASPYLPTSTWLRSDLSSEEMLAADVSSLSIFLLCLCLGSCYGWQIISIRVMVRAW